MEELITYILQFGQLGKQHTEHVLRGVTVLELAKGEHFSAAGKVPQQIGFVVQGVIRGYYYNDKGEEITRCFISENNLVADYVHFEATQPSAEYLQACTNCTLMVFSRQHWEELSLRVPEWDVIKSRMVQQCLYQKSRKGPVISQDATTRYLLFMEYHSSLINRIPLSYIASYLGITPQSLSRIRKNIR